MKAKKSFWTSITVGLTSAAPILLSCCKSGSCVGVCASPIASLFGISSASLANSPIIGAIESILIAVSAVSFTISYYSLYVLPKLNCNKEACACEPTAKEKRKVKINKVVFWTGLIFSIGFLSYFEILKYDAATAKNAAYSLSECAPGSCSEETAPLESCRALCDSNYSSCCEKKEKDLKEISIKSEITCPKCGHKEMEILPMEICQIKYTCKSCKIILYPKEGDCCVFCTYGDHKCPSKQ